MSKTEPTFEEAWGDFKAQVAKVFAPPLTRILAELDRALRRWTWLYRKFGGDTLDNSR
jgi:hypothetical protein